MPALDQLGTNPKDIVGSKKPSLSKVPAIAIAHEATAMMDGAGKYGPYNWRQNKVIASIYVDAAKRHIDAWFEGEEEAKDSKCHHLGHARACLGILLDAMETGNLVDDRPWTEGSDGVLAAIYEDLEAKIQFWVTDPITTNSQVIPPLAKEAE